MLRQHQWGYMGSYQGAAAPAGAVQATAAPAAGSRTRTGGTSGPGSWQSPSARCRPASPRARFT